jgi:hypothetical protein
MNINAKSNIGGLWDVDFISTELTPNYMTNLAYR